MLAQGNDEQVCTCTYTACTSDRMSRGAELTSGCSLAISQTPFLILSTNINFVWRYRLSTMANFRDAGIYGDYVHEAFSNPHAEIRLVLIDQSGDKDSEIHCTISTHPVNCLPAYNAISYTWGDTTATSKKHRVWVNGKQVNVGHNSWLALWQSRLHFVGATLWIWIDVLSIDHTNDGEKSIQVGMMGHIYQTASSVLASVGDHENDSEFLAEQIYAHIGYINHWRQKDGQRRNPPPKHCCGCGRQRGAPGQLHMLFDNSIELEHHASKEVMHRCTNCTVDFVFCDSCAGDHERPGHTLVGNPLRSYHEVFRKCTRCGQYLPLRWYAAKTGGNIKHCESCKQLDDNGATDADLELVLSDEWGPIDTGVGYLGLSAAPSKWETCRRFSEMSVDSRQRMMDALLVFSMRPYFTRLWVRIMTSNARSSIPAQLTAQRLFRRSSVLTLPLSLAAMRYFPSRQPRYLPRTQASIMSRRLTYRAIYATCCSGETAPCQYGMSGPFITTITAWMHATVFSVSLPWLPEVHLRLRFVRTIRKQSFKFSCNFWNIKSAMLPMTTTEDLL